jgi:hypothetical protein
MNIHRRRCRISIGSLPPQKKVHDGTDVTVLQTVTRLMTFKSKYNISNQCYNDIVKLIIDLIPAKHNITPRVTKTLITLVSPVSNVNQVVNPILSQAKSKFKSMQIKFLK